jgi:hypothetical protein
MPAAGMHAASNGRDFGTSRWLLCTTLHQLIIMWKSMESQKLGTELPIRDVRFHGLGVKRTCPRASRKRRS